MRRLTIGLAAGMLASGAAAEFRIAPDGTNDMTRTVMSAVDRVRADGGGRIVFAPGDWHFASPQKCPYYVSNHDNPMPRNVFLPMTNLVGVTFESDGARFVCHGEGIAFALIDTRDVTVRGLAFDYARPYFTEWMLRNGRLTATDSRQYPYEIDAKGKLVTVGPGWREEQHLAAFFDATTRAFLGREWWDGKADHDFSKFPDGSVVVTRNAYRPNPCVFLYRAKDTVFRACGAYSSAGMGLIAQRSEAVTVVGWKTRGTRFTGLQADATHFSNCRGQIAVTDSLFEGMVDDAINVHSTSLRIVEKKGARTIVCQYMHKQSVGFEVFLPGETLRFIKGATLEPGIEVRVEAVKTLAFDRIELTLEAEVPSAYGAGDAVENADWQPSVDFSRNTVRNCSPRATLFTTPGRIVCASNVFSHVAGQPIYFAGDAWDWYESGACRDVTVRGNVFDHCAEISGKGMIQIGPAVHDLDAQKERYHRNILVEDNVFSNFTKPLVFGQSVDNLVLRNNRIVNGSTNIVLKGAGRVVVEPAGTGVRLLDFEDPAEVKRLPTYRTKQQQTSVTNVFASSGKQSFFFRMARWRKGENEWPLFILPFGGSRDLSGYDRLAIDLVSLGDGGDGVSLSLSGPGVGDFGGLGASTVLKAREAMQWIVPLEKWPEKMSVTNVTKIGFCVARPDGCEVFIDNLTLLKPGEEPPKPQYSAASLALLKARQDAYVADRAAKLAAMKAKLRRDGAAGLLVGQATTMEHRRPEETFDLRPADKLSIRLARNEYEGVQVFAVPDGCDLKGVRVTVSPLEMRRGGRQKLSQKTVVPAKDVKVYTVGYVKTVKSPRHYRLPDGQGASVKCPTGWWPDPLLDFVEAADVKEGTVQGFWLNVRADESLPAGLYDGVVTVSAANAASVAIPLEVRVNDFTLPKTAVIPTAISFHPPIITTWDKVAQARKKDPNDVSNIWKRHEDEWTDFAADHLISVDYLYPACGPRFDQLMRLKEQGRLAWFNLGYWRHDDRDGVTGSEKWRKQWFPTRDKAYAKAKELGILDHAYLYGEDEIPKKDFPKIAIAAKCFKERYPGVPLLTTCFDPDFGINGSPLKDIDWFTPLTDMYDLEKAEASRAAGHKVWWYISNLPLTGWANMFVEKEPIETRLLMGAMTEKMKVDGFLFYATCSWGKNRKPITSGPYTDWDPVSYEDYHGCGSWMYLGPDGTPVPTIRLENYRDGLEDLAYAKLLRQRGLSLPVPEDVMKSMTDFTQRPEPLQRWRDRMADLLEGPASQREDGVADAVVPADRGKKAGTADDAWDWIDGTKIPMEGHAFPDSLTPYTRLPASAKDKVVWGIWAMSQCSAGLQFRFTTDSRKLKFRWSLTSKTLSGWNLPTGGLSGIDVYSWSTRRPDGTKTDGEWWFRKAGAARRQETNELEIAWSPGQPCLVNLPLYNGIAKFELGVEKGKSVKPLAVPHRAGVTKPVVFYGGSIVQGASASRPGTCWPNLVGRMLDVPIVNMGFNGQGKMEDVFVDYLASIDASCYVFMNFGNMGVQLCEERYEKFLRTLHARRPDAPLVIGQHCYYLDARGPLHAFAPRLIERLKKEDPEFAKCLHLVRLEDMFAPDSDGTVDGGHPNDWGSMHMAKAFAGVVAKALELGK